jgi:predicted N-acetyltransferase YhbS
MEIQHGDHKYHLRTAVPGDAPKLRLLLNAAYKELADLGLNYTATYQGETETLEQIENYRVFVLVHDDEIVGTINGRDENWFTGLRSFYLGKFAVRPDLKGTGLGNLLMYYAEEIAAAEGYESIQLDTAKPAAHLVERYLRRGYRIIGETHFEGKTYDSWIFEKRV